MSVMQDFLCKMLFFVFKTFVIDFSV